MAGREFWPRRVLTLHPWSTSLRLGFLLPQMDSASLRVSGSHESINANTWHVPGSQQVLSTRMPVRLARG